MPKKDKVYPTVGSYMDEQKEAGMWAAADYLSRKRYERERAIERRLNVILTIIAAVVVVAAIYFIYWRGW